MFEKVIFNVSGILFFLYIFWKKLKEDYLPTQIFNTAFIILLLLLVGNIATKYFFSHAWFWLSICAISIGLTIQISRYKLRVFETIEAAVIAFLPWTGFIFLSDSISNQSVKSFIAAIVVLFLIILYIFLNKYYKGFSWYKSGRVGFSGLTILGILFLIRAFVAGLSIDVLSFSVEKEAILSALVAFVIFLAVFNLARRS